MAKKAISAIPSHSTTWYAIPKIREPVTQSPVRLHLRHRLLEKHAGILRQTAGKWLKVVTKIAAEMKLKHIGLSGRCYGMQIDATASRPQVAT